MLFGLWTMKCEILSITSTCGARREKKRSSPAGYISSSKQREEKGGRVKGEPTSVDPCGTAQRRGGGCSLGHRHAGSRPACMPQALRYSSRRLSGTSRGCQTVPAQRFPCPGAPEGVKRRY